LLALRWITLQSLLLLFAGHIVEVRRGILMASGRQHSQSRDSRHAANCLS
jgi:hypothetical protein